MLQAGKSVTTANDPLVKVQPDYLYHAVKNPKPELEAAIRQLRLVRAIDDKRYAMLKRQLPYVTCGIFNPPYRRTENFAWINHFIIDLDHLQAKEINPAALKLRLSGDPQVKMVFLSPGEDGLKVLFGLKEKCYDPVRYALFYKVFVNSMANRYQLEQVVDTHTSDVTRACFISYDPDVFYNPDADVIDIKAWVDFDNPLEVKEIQHQLKLIDKDSPVPANEPSEEIKGPADDELAAIKARLNPNARSKREKDIFIPEEVESITNELIARMTGSGIETTSVTGINYGKKFRFRLKYREAEINLFYGKRGYTVVQTPRAGTDKELNEVCAAMINEMFN